LLKNLLQSSLSQSERKERRDSYSLSVRFIISQVISCLYIFQVVSRL